MRKNKKVKRNYLKLIIFVFLIVALGLVVFISFPKRPFFWHGKSGLTIALTSHKNDFIVLSLVPAKKTASIVEIPAETQIETPWFGKYLVKKLPLLSEQEKSNVLIKRSLSYSLGIPIDQQLPTSQLQKTGQSWKKTVSNYFRPWQGVEEWFLWRYLSNRDLVWEEYNLKTWSKKETLADKRQVWVVNKELFLEAVGPQFTDPIVRRESLPVSVYNVGGKQNLADKTAEIIEQMGIRVVEIRDEDRQLEEECLIVSQEENQESSTVRRLKKVFGCQFQSQSVDGLGKIKFYIKNVKI